MIVGVCKETFPGERRVALIPEVIAGLTKQSLDVVVESGAGQEAGFWTPRSKRKARGSPVTGSRCSRKRTSLFK